VDEEALMSLFRYLYVYLYAFVSGTYHNVSYHKSPISESMPRLASTPPIAIANPIPSSGYTQYRLGIGQATAGVPTR